MLVVRLGACLALLCAAAMWIACDQCPFRNITRLDVDGVLGCCGASARHEITVSDGSDRQVDLANTRFPSVAGTVDLWLVRADCEQLFDGAYPGASARCPTLIGPVAPDAVSARITLAGGRYRVFAQAHSSNAEPTRYVGDVGVWGRDCKPVSPTQP